MKIDRTETGLSIHIELDADVAEMVRRLLIKVLQVVEERYQVNRKIFMPEEKQAP